jgi:hypothetical protein
METAEQFELRKAKTLCKLRIEAGKDRFVYKRTNPKLLERIAQWERWTYADEVKYRKGNAKR